MFKKHTGDTSIILKNLSYLSVVRFVNIGVKFLLVAYLIRVLGEMNYGILTWSDAIVQFLIIIVNFGFNIYAAKYIVEHKDDLEKRNEVLTSIFSIKLALLILSFLILYVLSFFEPFFAYRSILLLMLLFGFGEVFFPIWYFQGMEKLKEAMYIVVFSKLFLLLTTFIWVKDAQDLYVYIVLWVLANIVMGLIGYLILVKKYQFKPVFAKRERVVSYLNEAFLFFVGLFLSLTFNLATIFLIGTFFSMDYVAGFDVALKIVLVAIIPFDVLQQAVYPTIFRNKDKKLLKRLILLSLIGGIALMLFIYFFAEHLLGLFGGAEVVKYAEVLRILSMIVPLAALTFILGTSTLVAFGFTKEFNYSLIISAIIFIVIAVILRISGNLTFWSLVYLRVISDLILVAIRIYFVAQKRILAV